MLYRLRHLLSFVLLFVAAAVASAQEADTLIFLDEITVTAARSEVAVREAPQRVTVLDRHAIESAGASSLAGVLEARTTAFVRRYGEGLATLSVRGSSPSQSLVLLEGIPFSDPQLGQIDLSLLPSILFERVELLHGHGSSLHGSGAVGATVNLQLREPAENSAVHLLLGAGPYGSRTIAAGAGAVRGRMTVHAAGEYMRTDGDFPFTNSVLFPPREVRRTNADREHQSFYGSVALAGTSHVLKAGMWYAAAERGLPGPAISEIATERQWDEHFRLWVAERAGVGGGILEAKAHLQATGLRYRNVSLGIDDEGRTWSGAGEVEWHRALSGGWTTSAGGGLGLSRADHPSLAAEAREVHMRLAISATGRLGVAHLFPAIRLDRFSSEDGDGQVALSPRIGFNVQPLRDIPVHIKAAVSRAFRRPTFNDRYWQPGGNPDLEPEKAWSLEAAILAAAGRAMAEVTVYHSVLQDQIVWSPEQNGIWVPENIARSRAAGLEASVRTELGRASRVRIDGGVVASVTHAVDLSNSSARTYGRQLRYIPRHQVKAFAGANRGRLRFDVNARYVGRRFVTSDESAWLDGVFVADAKLAVGTSIGGAEVGFSIILENALDARYAWIRHYPMPPRHVGFQLLIDL